MSDDFRMPPAPGEFVAPEPVRVSAPDVPSVALAPRPPAPPPVPGPVAEGPSFDEIQQDMLLQMRRQQAMQQRQYAAMGAEQPAPASNGENSLGLTLLAVAAGAVLGGVFAGGVGGAAGGALLGAAAANGLRAAKGVTKGDEASDKEAAVDGAFALAGAAAGVYLLYKTSKGESFLSNKEDKKEEPEEGDEDEGDEPEDEDEPEEGEAKVNRPLLGPAPGVKVTKLEDDE